MARSRKAKTTHMNNAKAADCERMRDTTTQDQYFKKIHENHT